MKLSVFCGVSVDGFLARPNHALDFLSAGEQAPHGFEEFYGSVDVVVIGSKTFEVVLAFGKWFYGKRPVGVLRHPSTRFLIGRTRAGRANVGRTGRNRSPAQSPRV